MNLHLISTLAAVILAAVILAFLVGRRTKKFEISIT